MYGSRRSRASGVRSDPYHGTNERLSPSPGFTDGTDAGLAVFRKTGGTPLLVVGGGRDGSREYAVFEI